MDTAKGATRDGRAKWRRAGVRKHNVRLAGLRSGSRENGRGAESSDGENEDEGADRDEFHNLVFLLSRNRYKVSKFFSGQTRYREHRVIEVLSLVISDT